MRTASIDAIRQLLFGGPGSGCHGDNCGRPQKVFHLPKPLHHAYLKLEPPPQSWHRHKNWHEQAYGGVLVNEKGQFLLREPAGHFDGYSWTFPKGKMDHKFEHPVNVAVREVAEETGRDGKIFDELPGTFQSGSGSHSSFYLMRSNGFDPSKMDKETASTKWVSYDEAKKLIGLSKNSGGRARDLEILEKANNHLKKYYSGKIVAVGRPAIQTFFEAGGPGSGCHGDNCGRPKGPDSVQEKHWTPEKRAAYTVSLGKAWVDKTIAGDKQIPGLLDKANTLEDRYQRLDKAMDKLSAYTRQFFKLSDSEKDLNQTNFQQVSKKLGSLMEKSSELFRAKQAANLQLSEAITKKIGSGLPVSQPLNIQRIDHPNGESIQYQAREFEKAIGGAPPGNPEISIYTTGGKHSGANFGRSYYEDATKSIYLRPTAGRETVWHELGHWLEHSTPGGKLAALSFLDTRTQGEETKKLQDLDPKKPGYENWEQARKDQFTEPYVGKIYKNGDATEITSMGMQYLAEDPAKLYRWDKEHFYFTLGMIRGARAGGFPWGK